MRTPEEIKIGEKTLEQILADHKTWLTTGATEGRADLRGANLRGADLSGVDLRGADLSRADLRGADLRGVDLRGADLSDAYLSGADLRGADLGRANLGYADLGYADLGYVDLSGAESILSIGPGGSRGDMLYAVKHETCVMVKTGCFWGNLDEFKQAVSKTHTDNSHARYYAAVRDLIEVYFQGK